MIFFEAAFLTCLIVTGTLTAISDFKYSIVENRTLLITVACSLLIHIISICVGIPCDYMSWIINFLIGSSLAVVMYAGKMWAAGDAKLFIALYTMVCPWYLNGASYVYGVVPYIYIFVPSLLWVFVDTIIRILRKEERKKTKADFKNILKNIFIVFVNTTALYYVCAVCIPGFVEENALLISAVIIIYGFVCLHVSWLKTMISIFIHACVLAGVLLISQVNFMWPGLESYISIIAVFLIQRFSSLYNYQRIMSKDVKKGMILSAETVILFQKSRIHNLPCNPTEELNAKITEDEAQAVIRWAGSVNGQEYVWIVRKIPFAMMVTIGFILWVTILLVR